MGDFLLLEVFLSPIIEPRTEIRVFLVPPVVLVTHVVPAGLGEVISQHLISAQDSEAGELEEDPRGGSLQDLFV